jgi:Na+-transporting methylmalonyl-CoA/oxaloacetate decarboxylase gamma subunit
MEGTEFVLAILFLFVLPIVIIGTFTSHRKEMAKMKLKLGEAQADKVSIELESVKSRLEVLEAIVTDKKYQLNSEFDALRNENTAPRQ